VGTSCSITSMCTSRTTLPCYLSVLFLPHFYKQNRAYSKTMSSCIQVGPCGLSQRHRQNCTWDYMYTVYCLPVAELCAAGSCLPLFGHCLHFHGGMSALPSPFCSSTLCGGTLTSHLCPALSCAQGTKYLGPSDNGFLSLTSRFNAGDSLSHGWCSTCN